MTNAGDGSGRLFAVSQYGKIRIIENGTLGEEPFLDITDQVTCCFERGLLSLAFHPDYELNGRFFIFYVDLNGDSTLSSFVVSGEDPNLADAESEEVLLIIPQESPMHKGGQLRFGPDGMLYASVGDGGAVAAEAQNIRSLYGSILRLDVDVPNGYAIPEDNPFSYTPLARGEIWAYGLRNPWRFSFDRETGDAFIADVGHQAAEEINFLPADSPGGENYGWNVWEGDRCNGGYEVCRNPLFTEPIMAITHKEDDCNAIIGGFRYRGTRYPQLWGLYFFGDFCHESITVLREAQNGWVVEAVFEDIGQVSSFGEDENGELYFAEFAGSVVQITAPPVLPALTTVSTSVLATDSPAATLTLEGKNYIPTSEARWNGSPRPTTFVSTTRLQVMLSAEDLSTAAAGLIDVSTPGAGGGISEAVEVAVLDPGDLMPAIGVGGIVDAASYDPNLGVSPGSIASVFGLRLALEQEASVLVPLPSHLGGASAVMGEGLQVPFYVASEGQHNVQIPWEAAELPEPSLRVRVGANVSAPEPLLLVEYSPGLFATNGMGTGQAAALIAGSGGSIAAPEGMFENSRPVRPGEFLLLFANGLGAVTNQPPTGGVARANPLSETVTDPIVRLNGMPIPVSFSGLTPGLVGLYQVNAGIPADAQPDPAASIEIEIGGVTSRALTIAVGSP